MRLVIGDVVSIVTISLEDSEVTFSTDEQILFLSAYKKALKTNPDSIQFHVGKLVITDVSEYGYEGEVIGGTQLVPGQEGSCTKRGIWVFGETTYLELETFKTTLKRNIDLNTIKHINALLRQYEITPPDAVE